MRIRALALALVVGASAGGCTGVHETGETAREHPAAVAVATPRVPLTVVADADPVASAVSTSRALFSTAEVVVLARSGDRSGVLLAASTAVGLGVPLLLEPAEARGRTRSGAAELLPGPVTAELGRLRARTVLAVGSAERSGDGAGRLASGIRLVSVPADAPDLRAATGLQLSSPRSVPADGVTSAVAVLPTDGRTALRAAGEPGSSHGSTSPGTLPPVSRPRAATGVTVLATEAPESLAGVATARAAGVPVVVTGASTDPRGSQDAVRALSAQRPRAVVAVGAGFAAEPGLAWKVATATRGDELPGGGQLLFPGRRLVALYGHPGTAALGVLGEQDLQASIQRARETAAQYAPLVAEPVVPAFEILATVASTAPGADGDFSAESAPEELRPWVEAAGKAGLYVILDLQPGRTDFLTQAQRYRSLLEMPHVGLALDPEWRLGPNQVHLKQTGSVGVDEVNRVIAWLADLTRQAALPQKLLVLHQFQLGMIQGRERLDTSRDELAVMLHADGQGGQGSKQDTWRTLHQDAPAGIAWGWKNFYDEDKPMLTPQQTVQQVAPLPQLVTYQ